MNSQDYIINSNAPQFVTSDSTVFPREYALWLKDIKLRYRQAQCKAAIKVNTELLQFYWQLGKDIVAMRIEDLSSYSQEDIIGQQLVDQLKHTAYATRLFGGQPHMEGF